MRFCIKKCQYLRYTWNDYCLCVATMTESTQPVMLHERWNDTDRETQPERSTACKKLGDVWMIEK